jgi:hypothetical protein
MLLSSLTEGFYDLSQSLRVCHERHFPNFHLIIINFDITIIFPHPKNHGLPLTYLLVKESELRDVMLMHSHTFMEIVNLLTGTYDTKSNVS